MKLAAVGDHSSASRKSAEALDQVRTRLRGYGADFVSVGAIIFARSLPGFLSKEASCPTPRGRRAALIEADPIALNGRIEEAARRSIRQRLGRKIPILASVNTYSVNSY